MKVMRKTLVLLGCLWIAPLVYPQSDALQDFKHVASANALEQEGKPPFHLKVAYQLFDIDGKPSETGTIEEWWASPESYRVAISSPSLNVIEPEQETAIKSLGSREKFLVDRLLVDEVHPFPHLSSGVKIEQGTQTFGQMKLDCFIGIGNLGATFCVDPALKALRVEAEAGATATARNNMEVFHDSIVADQIQISYQDHQAITGRVISLEGFDPSTSDLKLLSPPPATDRTGNGNNNLTGKGLTRPNPDYPEAAKREHMGGTVVFHALISKQGTVADLVPIASRSPALTDAAMKAVKKWTYQPSLLNGQPTEIDTVIEVRFNLNR